MCKIITLYRYRSVFSVRRKEDYYLVWKRGGFAFVTLDGSRAMGCVLDLARFKRYKKKVFGTIPNYSRYFCFRWGDDVRRRMWWISLRRRSIFFRMLDRWRKHWTCDVPRIMCLSEWTRVNGHLCILQ